MVSSRRTLGEGWGEGVGRENENKILVSDLPRVRSERTGSFSHGSLDRSPHQCGKKSRSGRDYDKCQALKWLAKITGPKLRDGPSVEVLQRNANGAEDNRS